MRRSQDGLATWGVSFSSDGPPEWNARLLNISRACQSLPCSARDLAMRQLSPYGLVNTFEFRTWSFACPARCHYHWLLSQVGRAGSSPTNRVMRRRVVGLAPRDRGAIRRSPDRARTCRSSGLRHWECTEAWLCCTAQSSRFPVCSVRLQARPGSARGHRCAQQSASATTRRAPAPSTVASARWR
jgi:hypothetical protein